MLEKLVLLSVAFFSIGTEMRLLVEEDNTKEEFLRSELWHAQSVFFGGYYLPKECPLVTHIINSYLKHYVESGIHKLLPAQGSDDKRERKTSVLQKYLIKQIIQGNKKLQQCGNSP